MLVVLVFVNIVISFVVLFLSLFLLVLYLVLLGVFFLDVLVLLILTEFLNCSYSSTIYRLCFCPCRYSAFYQILLRKILANDSEEYFSMVLVCHLLNAGSELNTFLITLLVVYFATLQFLKFIVKKSNGQFA